MVKYRNEDLQEVMCGGSVLLGQLRGVSRSVEQDFLFVRSYPRFSQACSLYSIVIY